MIVNKPFTMPEYNTERKNKLLQEVAQIEKEAVDYPRLSIDKLLIIVRTLIGRAYGNNHTETATEHN